MPALVSNLCSMLGNVHVDVQFTIGSPEWQRNAKALSWVLPIFAKFPQMAWKCFWGNPRLFDGRFVEDPDFAKKRYNEWNAEVKAEVPKDRLLVFNVKEGWAPLCRFLGVAEPSIPFPHINDLADFNAKLAKYNKMQTAVMCSAAALLAMLGVGVAYAVARSQR